MKKYLIPLTAAVLLLTSCSQINEQKYNDTVVNMYAAYSSNIVGKMATVGNASDKQKAMADIKSIEKTTDSCISVMNGLNPSEAAKDFHQKVLVVFRTVKSGFVPLAGKITSLNAGENVDAYNKLVDDYNSLTVKINQAESAAQAAQRIYVSKIGMRIK